MKQKGERVTSSSSHYFPAINYYYYYYCEYSSGHVTVTIRIFSLLLGTRVPYKTVGPSQTACETLFKQKIFSYFSLSLFSVNHRGGANNNKSHDK